VRHGARRTLESFDPGMEVRVRRRLSQVARQQRFAGSQVGFAVENIAHRFGVGIVHPRMLHSQQILDVAQHMALKIS
jgi:hypothetical protein